MKVYEGANIRNVAVMGHGHAGKTSLVSAMLYTAGATQRMGRVDDGSAATDYDDEEIARKMSISTGLAYAEWGKTKINVLDTPGFNMFVHEARCGKSAGLAHQRVWKNCYSSGAADRKREELERRGRSGPHESV